jgi:hypothetical protein
MSNIYPTPSGTNSTAPLGEAVPAATAHDTLMVVAIELLGVGLFTLVAGTSPDVGTLVVLFMVGLWLIYLISDAKTVAGIGSALQTIANGAA